jgi:hypothetical protein
MIRVPVISFFALPIMLCSSIGLASAHVTSVTGKGMELYSERDASLMRGINTPISGIGVKLQSDRSAGTDIYCQCYERVAASSSTKRTSTKTTSTKTNVPVMMRINNLSRGQDRKSVKIRN